MAQSVKTEGVSCSPEKGPAEEDQGVVDKTMAKPETPAKGKNSLLRVFSYADGLSWTLNIIAFIAAICAGTLLPLMDLVFGQFVTVFTDFATNKISPAEYRSAVNKYTLYFVYLFIGKFALFYIHSFCISVSAIRTTKAIRVDFVRHTLKQDIAFFDRAEAGSITSYITTNATNINTGISEKLTLTIQMLSTFVTAFVIAFAVQWKLTLITIAVVPTIVIMVGISVGAEAKNEKKMLSIYARAGQLSEEVFSTMRTVHSYWLHPLLSNKYDTILEEAMVIGMKKSKIYAVLFSTEFFCIYCAYGLAFWQGIRMYVSGEIKNSGSVFIVILAVVVAASVMSTLAPQAVNIAKAASSAEELFKTIDRESEIDPMSTAGHLPEHCEGRVELQDVDFSYPTRPDVPVLKNFTLSVPANSTTAIVGPSGSGKSTCVGLLERWYNPLSGSVTVDGFRVQDLNLAWLRTNIRLVQQEPVLLSGTVFENVSCGLHGTSMADLPEAEQRKLVKEACEAAYATEFIDRLPHGYDTQIGERAIMLSGGQKQRLAIARSIISNPRVLLFDEATSALDPKAEKMVQKALDKVSKDRTTIVIAHKLSTVRQANNIVVMTNGEVVEQGTHDALIELDGAYARLVRAQDLGNAEERLEAEMDDEEKPERMALTRTENQAYSIHENAASQSMSDGINYNLFKCIYIVLTEHLHLWRYFLILFVGALIGGCTFPAQALLFARIARAFELPAGEAVSTGDFYSLMFFIVALGNLVAYGLIGFFSNRVVQHVGRGYRLEIFQLILKQDMNFFDKKENASGSLAANLTNYPNSLTELLGFNIMLITINVVNVLSSSILAIAVGWKLGLSIVFGALPVVVFLGYLRIRLEFKLEDQISKQFNSSAALASEAVAAIRTVSSLALERHIVSKYEQELDGVAKRSLKFLTWTMFWYSLTQSVSFLAMALGFWYGGQLISRGEYDTIMFYTVFIAVIFSGEAAASFFSYTTSMTKSGTAANYIFWLRRRRLAVQEDPSKPPFDKDRKEPAHTQVQNASFAYESRPNTYVLQGVDVDAKPGQFIAFVGASGCGKSSLISLLERFYDPSTGRILHDGQSLVDLDPRKYRREVSLVQQEPVLYQGSIGDNIAMGLSQNAETEEVEAAAKQANIYTFVTSLPEGFNTPCGSRGTQLSGGQRQRIAIARALIRQPRLLLLDEATSALDTESEKIVQAALETAKAGRTTIAVAHRLSTIKDADVIVVFASGRIAEVGSHSDLLGRRGLYYDMCMGQSLDRSVR